MGGENMHEELYLLGYFNTNWNNAYASQFCLCQNIQFGHFHSQSYGLKFIMLVAAASWWEIISRMQSLKQDIMQRTWVHNDECFFFFFNCNKSICHKHMSRKTSISKLMWRPSKLTWDNWDHTTYFVDYVNIASVFHIKTDNRVPGGHSTLGYAPCATKKTLLFFARSHRKTPIFTNFHPMTPYF